MHLFFLNTLSATAAAASHASGGGAWLLPAMVLVPLATVLALILAPAGRDGLNRGLTLLSTLIVFALSLCAAGQFDWSAAPTAMHPYQLYSYTPWIPGLGVGFRFGIDAVALWLILLTTFLFPLTILGSYGDDLRHRSKEFYIWLMVLQAALIGVFTSADVILFYVFFELTLVPLFFLIGIFGSGNRRYAALKFFVFTLAGSLFTLAAIIYVAYFHASQAGVWTFSIPDLIETARGMSHVSVTIHTTIFGILPLIPYTIHTSAQHLVLAGLLAGFAVKVPLFPVHTWLPLAHTEAPTSGSVILAGVLLKLGSYGLYRFAVPMAPEAIVDWAGFIGVICIIGILYTALICWVQSDLKKLVAYSSVSHMGFCILGLVALNLAGVGGSVMYMINHGLSTGALFLCVGMIYNRYHTREMSQMGGFGKRLPVWSTFFVFFALASVGLPGLNGFVGEFLTVLGAYTAQGVLGIGYAAFAALGLILAAIYILYMVGRVVMGPLREPAEHAGHVEDLSVREIAVLTPLAIACLVIGLYPTPILHSLEGAINYTTAAANENIKGRMSNPEITPTASAPAMQHPAVSTAAVSVAHEQRTLAEVSR